MKRRGVLKKLTSASIGVAVNGFSQQVYFASTESVYVSTDSVHVSTGNSLHNLALSGNVEKLFKRLVKLSSSKVVQVDGEGRTVFHRAVESEKEDVVKLLVDYSFGKTLIGTKHGRVDIGASIQDKWGRTPLHLAVSIGKTGLVELVLEVTKDVDVPGPNDRTPMHLAVLDCKLEIVQLLIKRGANPLQKDKEETTPIGIAARAGYLEILYSFFTMGNNFDMLESTSGPYQSSLLHLAVESGNVVAVVFLLTTGINKRLKDELDLTAAHVASRIGNVLMLRHLIESDPWLANAASDDGLTPVHMAVKVDHVKALKFLLSAGASLSTPTSTGASPLMIASFSGSSHCVRELLLSGADYMALHKNGMNVLQLAVGHDETLRVLVEDLNGKPGFEELVNSRNSAGATALHLAAEHGEASDVVLLVKHGSHLDAVDENGSTPLHLATARGHLEIVVRLTMFAPRLLKAVDNLGRTPLQVACLYGRKKVVMKLLEKGAALTRDRDGRTAFHYAAWHGSVDCVKALLRAFPAELDRADREKATALHLAAISGHPDVVQCLLDQDAAVTDNDRGQNCLDLAIASGQDRCAMTIVNHERWEETMKALGESPIKHKTQLQQMVEKVPNAALVVMNKCVVTHGDTVEQKREFNFSYMLGITNRLSQVPAMVSVQLLNAMVKFNRTACLAHPLCVEFLNSRWRKFGAAVVMGNTALYLSFLFLLMAFIIVFPEYTPNPLHDQHSLQRLVGIVQAAKKENRNSFNAFDKLSFCYGHLELRLAVISVTIVCLLKEFLPLWYQGLQYFKKPSNVCELTVYAMTLVFLDPYQFLFESLDIPSTACPKHAWEIAAVTVFLSWIVLLLNIRRLPHVGIYMVMMTSMMKTMLQFVVVACLFVPGFGLAFYMLQEHQGGFSSGGLSLMKAILMILGDFAYDDVLPPSLLSDDFNVNSTYALLHHQYGDFPFVRHLPNISLTSSRCHTVNMTCSNNATVAVSNTTNGIDFPPLFHLVLVALALLMNVVVLNTLIGLAVGDIAAVQTDAAVRQIRMQVKLLVELESALPSWFLNLVQVTQSSRSSRRGNSLRGWLRRVTEAAVEPSAIKESHVAAQLTQIKTRLNMLDTWLENVEGSVEQQLVLLKSLAVRLKRQQSEALATSSSCNSVQDVEPVLVPHLEQSLCRNEGTEDEDV